MQMNPVQKSFSKLFGAWLAVRDTVDDGHCDCIEKADVSLEHRDESNFTELPEHRDESKFKKSHHEHRDGSKFKKSGHEDRDGSKNQDKP